MPLAVITLGILFLFFLILVVRLNAFIAFILVGLAIGVGQGMELNTIVQSIEKGIGNTLGFLVMILGLGAMLGKLVGESGAAQKITNGLIQLFGYSSSRQKRFAILRHATHFRSSRLVTAYSHIS